MSNGVAGCGWGYADTKSGIKGRGYVCPHLIPTRDGFYCSKFRDHLGMHEKTGHPFRCTPCKGSVS